MVKGNKVYLSAIEEKELGQLREWRNLPEYRKYFREYREISPVMQKKWFENVVNNNNGDIMFGIHDIETNGLLGCCGLCYINWIHRYADLSLYIGKDNCYIDDEGIAEESCRLLFNYAFDELGLNKIWTEIYEFDNKKFDLYKHMGFKQDGFLREQYYYRKKWWNSYILSLLHYEYSDGL